jgi:hypothetical protein
MKNNSFRSWLLSILARVINNTPKKLLQSENANVGAENILRWEDDGGPAE